MTKLRITVRAALLCSCFGMASLAHAEDASTSTKANGAEQPADQTGRIDEIVVTAQRKNENQQSVPVAITAFDPVKLERQGITNVESLQLHAPNVSIRDEVSVGGLSIGIRGINVSVDNFAYDSAVGVYENGVFIARGHSFNASFYDVGNVQILRGPQGTLFGRDTPVGALLIDTHKVDDKFGGYFKVGVGGGGNGIGKGEDRGFYRVEAALNLPISDGLGVRIAGYGLSDDGWAKSRKTNYRFRERHDYGMRATIHFVPSPSIDGNLVLSFDHQYGTMPMNTAVEFTPSNPLTYADLTTADKIGGSIAPGDHPYTDLTAALAANWQPYQNESLLSAERLHKKSYSAALNLNFTLGDHVNLRSITGYRGIRNYQINDSVGAATPKSTATDTTNQDQFSQEFVLTADLQSNVHLTTGVNFFQEWGNENNTIASAAIAPHFGVVYSLSGDDILYTSKSVFGNLAVDVLPNFTLSAGGRYAQEDKRLRVNTNLYLFSGPLFLNVANEVDRFSGSVFVYDLKAQWKAASNLLLYAKYGTGYRAGGTGFRGPNSTFQPERSNTTELGGKFDFDGSVPARLNVALFHTNYKNFQVSVTETTPTVHTNIVNAGGARINGAEFEFSVRPVPNLDLSASLGLVDAKYTSFTLRNTTFGPSADFSRNKLRFAPSTTLSISASYKIETGIGNLVPAVDWSHQSTFYTDAQYQPTAPVGGQTNAFRQGPTNIVNAKLTLEGAFGSSADISFWGKNLTDQVRQSYGLALGAVKAASFGEPLSYGVDIRLAF